MTLFFNLDNLDREAGDNFKRYVWLLHQHYYRKLPSKRDPFKREKLSLAGTSFILNPAELFKETSIDTAYLVQYIRLAGRRDYLMYKEYGIASLPLSYFPDLELRNITHNPLLKITEDDLFFKYERNKNGNRIQEH